jgi:hypothetical protein
MVQAKQEKEYMSKEDVEAFLKKKQKIVVDSDRLFGLAWIWLIRITFTALCIGAMFWSIRWMLGILL